MLAETPAVFILLGLVAYTVLAGADFGAGFWTLASPGGPTGTAIRDHARHAMGPVWEANHVWLIFVLVVCWTAYPVAYASIVSTLAVPLFIAAIGIVLRGAAYALRGQLDTAGGRRGIENVFALSSVLTPFALGTVAGAIAAGRVPVGNAEGNALTSWLNPTSVLIGLLAVAISGFLAAVYLAADARRLGDHELEHTFRSRALWTGAVTGALALAALLVVRLDAPLLWDGFTRGGGLLMVGVSAAAGLATLALVWRSHFGWARVSAALAVAAIVAGWAVAQEPRFLPGLTVSQAAAGRSTLTAVVTSVVVGAVVLVPSLMLLFGLLLRGRFDAGAESGPRDVEVQSATDGHRPGLVAAFALGCLLVGAGLLVFAGAGWLYAVAVACLCGCAAAAFVLATTTPEEADTRP
ncbi:MAG: Cytochrome bd-type quinol oxidase subunit 2-like protein [Mycobacterium sp.]|nr:Cytochrome bd-type quinol oxidase subunit 2-like protein [Mycobacterium sp.]